MTSVQQSKLLIGTLAFTLVLVRSEILVLVGKTRVGWGWGEKREVDLDNMCPFIFFFWRQCLAVVAVTWSRWPAGLYTGPLTNRCEPGGERRERRDHPLGRCMCVAIYSFSYSSFLFMLERPLSSQRRVSAIITVVNWLSKNPPKEEKKTSVTRVTKEARPKLIFATLLSLEGCKVAANAKKTSMAHACHHHFDWTARC